MENITFTVVCDNQEDFEAKKALIDFYSGLTEERKEKFSNLIATLNSLLIQNQE